MRQVEDAGRGKVVVAVSGKQKLYFAAVGLLALWVGAWGYLFPTSIDYAIPWLVPPLHARFLGAMYLSGMTLMIGAMLARNYAEVRVVVPMIAIWTGMLLIVSLFYLDAFDPWSRQVWFWFGAYIAYPLIALGLAWRYRHAADLQVTPNLPSVARVGLMGLGSITVVLALALLLAPDAMLPLWPWKITRMLAQIYSAPFLSYGVGCLLLSRRKAWPEIRAAVIGILVFVVGVLLASILHIAVFDRARIATRLWFGGFGLAALVLLALTIGSIQATPRTTLPVGKLA